nr:phytoene desaturase family protein [Haloquadratum walsbyi]
MTRTSEETSVIVIGGGFSGLSTACYLADAGVDVTMLERQDTLGGVAGRIERSGFQFDTGPSWYLMPDVFERFFDEFGHDPKEYYSLTRLDPNYRVFWKDGDTATLPADREGQRELFEQYETGAGAALDTYLEEAANAYEIGMEEFVYKHRPRLRDWVDPGLLRAARGITLIGSMDDHIASYFDSPKLRQLLEYTLVFLGGSPYNTPALYSLMSHVDFNMGVYYPTGGIASVVDGIETLARELGVNIELNTTVTGLSTVNDGDGVRVQTNTDARIADRVVSTIPPAYTDRNLLPEGVSDHDSSYWESQTYAPGAFLLYLGVEGELDSLEHHTLILPTDWESHFESIFDDPTWPADPSYYVNVPSQTDSTVAPDGHSTVVVLVPIAPGLTDSDAVREQYRQKVLSDLADHTGVDLRDRIVVEETACTSEFAAMGYPDGTALGLAHTLTQTGPFRPAHRSDAISGLYHAGSFTDPGIGMPMCLINGKHVSDAVVDDIADNRVSDIDISSPSTVVSQAFSSK